jgi:glycosyltransferase involved in cell wall biosynthesis
MSLSRGKKHLLFLSPLLAMPSQHGGCVYPHAILKGLHERGVRIGYGWLGSPLTEGRRCMRNPLQAEYVDRGWVRGAFSVGQFLLPSTLHGWRGLRDPEAADSSVNGGEHLASLSEKKFVARTITRAGAEHVLVDSTPMLTALDAVDPRIRASLHVAVLTHNLNHRRTELYREHGQTMDFLPMTRAEETNLLARADTIVAIQEREAERFREMLPNKRVITVPMPMMPNPLPPASAETQRCLFVGGFSGHNIEAVRWLLQDIWPSVSKQLPNAELVIAGTAGKSVREIPAGVRVVGAVEDLRSIYAEASVCLVPLPLGTGLKIKLVEAMGYGRAVITTPAGAEGFSDLEEGKVAVVAKDAATFTSEMCRLLRDPAHRAQIVARQLSWLAQSMQPEVALSPYLNCF